MKVHHVIWLLTLAVSGCDTSRPHADLPAPEQVLSQYQTIRIGSHKLTLPTIALLSSTRGSSLTLRDGTPVPIEDVLSQQVNGTWVSQISIMLGSYRELQDYDLDTFAHVSNAFCDRLAARWERNQCSLGLYDSKTVFTPQHFAVVERSHLIQSNVQLFAIAGPGPDGGDVARKLLSQPTAKLLHCEPTQKPLCTAVLPFSPDLVVVWATTPGECESDSARISWLMEQYLVP